ncbi:CGNR zinc finger domain-containing protein [Mucilaginibacter segetis]|uniref:CGNR zinc finger domain-containing protein n=1 Tax=Mucilaginibacter segetis TaxID=2793071 RepID=A0A934PS87_9SPHI|nr:CGNR zinc finger domain-containing protein [Mucilaginibacter segetis]MBK0379849.1 CGNR zinc finger domain-containing protein [Mucilaginibacter segetis]
MRKKVNIQNLPRIGGFLCLDFINTVQTRKKEMPTEYLRDYSEYLIWCYEMELLTYNELRETKLNEYCYAGTVKCCYKRIIDAREMLYRLFSLLAKGKPVAERVMQQFNAWVKEALTQTYFVSDKAGIRLAWNNPEAEFERQFWMIIKSAYDLLQSDKLKLLKECPGCGWLFLDTSAKGHRKWCCTETCGSISKAKKYYHTRIAAPKKRATKKAVC